MIRVVFLVRNYYPELTGIAPYATAMSEHLAKKGFDVTVVTSFPHFPEWHIHKRYKGKMLMRERLNGVEVLRYYVFVPSPHRALNRIVYELSFSVSSLAFIFYARRCDIIWCISPPITLGLTAYLLSLIKRVPFILEIRDLVAGAALATGMLRKGMFVRMLGKIERFVYDKATAISVISKGFAENLHSKGVLESKIHLIPNWIDLEFVRPLERNNIFRKLQGISEGQFVIMFSGAMGKKDNLGTILDAAALLREYKDILFMLIGEGIQKSHLMERAQRMGLPNIRFLPLQPKEIFPYVLSAADVLIVSYYNSVVDFCMPSKVLTYMASARPLVVAAHPESETAKTVQEAEAGLLVEPENPNAIVKAILELRDSDELRQRLGLNGRSFVSNHFEKSKVLKQFEELILAFA